MSLLLSGPMMKLPAAGASFDPLTEDAGLLDLWDASDETSITHSGGAVSAVASQVGGGVSMATNFSPETGLSAQDVNGLNTIYLDRSSQGEYLFVDLPVGSGGDIAVHLVYALPASRTAGTSIDGVLGVQSGAFEIRSGNATTFPGAVDHALDGSAGTTNFSTTGWEGQTVIFQVEFNFTAGTMSIWANGTSVVSGETYTSIISGTVRFIFGNTDSANRACQGSFCEAAISTDLSHRADYQSYLSSKWGV